MSKTLPTTRSHDIANGAQPAVPVPVTSFLKPASAYANEKFGLAVAISADGNTMAIGAPGDHGDANDASDPGAAAGGAYVFEHFVGEPQPWRLMAHLHANRPDMNDEFGTSVALSADGRLLLVGALNESSRANGVDGNDSDNSYACAGAAYVFMREGNVWAQRHYLKPSDTNFDMFFGGAVALSGDGRTIVVGAHGEGAAGGRPRSGAAYVFAASGSTWVQQAKLKGSTPQSGDQLTWKSLALSEDGNTLAAGAYRRSAHGEDLVEEGIVYVYARSNGIWSQQARLETAMPRPADSSMPRVLPLALSGNGNALAVGIHQTHADPALRTRAAARLYSRGNGTWSEDAVLEANGVDIGAFEVSVALSSTGRSLAIGTPRQSVEGVVQAGVVTVFKHGAEGWAQSHLWQAEFADAYDRFGLSLAFDDQGSNLVVGMPHEGSPAPGNGAPSEDNSHPSVGAVYAYYGY